MLVEMKSEFVWVSLVVYARSDLGELGAVLVALQIRIGSQLYQRESACVA